MLKQLLGAALLSLPLQALPSTERGPEQRLVDKYERFAGSPQNARELVEGLRNDTRIELTKGDTTAKFTPRTGKMGWGNVDHALALAQASLAQHGIHNPTPQQIKAALNGGEITVPNSGKPVTLSGVLELRASGMGWGKIAQEYGFKLGELKRADPHHKSHQAPEMQRAKYDHRPMKIERPEKFERPQRPERPEKPHHR